jgi:hypothetical protein
MIIANPIYDVVFKYLLEDIEIARELLSAILGEEIISIEIKPQETTTETPASSVSILRFDFKAVIKSPTGEMKKVLIELQKAKQVFDVMRFRRYLGDNYKKEDEVRAENGSMEKRPLPIVTIYFLGFPLDNIENAVVKINREYRDVITQEIIKVKEDFVELLTHDSYLIQIRKLVGKSRTKLERILQVFSLEYQTQNKHQMDFRGDVNEPLVKKIIDRLGRAIASDEIRDKMDVEDEIDRIFERELKKLATEKDKIIAEKDQELEAKDQELEAKDQELEARSQELEAERQKAEAERQKNEDLQREIEELKKQMKK